MFLLWIFCHSAFGVLKRTLGKYSAICDGEPLPSVFVLDAEHPLFGVCSKAEHVCYHIIQSNKLLIE